MPVDFRFRLSLYLTLAVASVCLALAEEPLVPGVSLTLIPVLALFLVGFLLEGRWTLPAWAANCLGVAIAGGWALWLDLRFFDDPESWRRSIPVAAALLPAIGPLLTVLLLVRLFRPKQRDDFWALQGLGLLQVALGCVLGFSPELGWLLLAYVACALWSLTLFALRGGTAGVGLGTPGGGQAVRPPEHPLRAVRWTAGVAALALLACLLLPRQDSDPWDPLRLLSAAQRVEAARAQTGAAAQIDMNSTGWVELDDEVALVVTAEDASGAPKLDMDSRQRWRGPVLDHYDGGRWESIYGLRMAVAIGGEMVLPADSQPARVADPFTLSQPPRQQLLELGPEKYFLVFEVEPRKAGGLFLADPAVLRGPEPRPGETNPITVRGGPVLSPLFDEFGGTLIPKPVPGRGSVVYRQVTVPPQPPDLGPLVYVSPRYADLLCRQPVPDLTAWTLQLVQRLGSRPDSEFTAADLALHPAPPRLAPDHPDGALEQKNWEKVARSLSAYLAHSPEYTYSLELRRQDRGIDPTLDFLQNVKAGHCSRYAGGLALMLRSLGIPARIVTGFRGAEGRGDGRYEVRNSMAHAWVEILLPPSGPAPPDHGRWLALDPTPTGEAGGPPLLSVSRWWVKGQEAWKSFWKDFVVEYNADRQEEMWSDVVSSLEPAGRWRQPAAVAGGLLAAAAVLLALRLVRRLCQVRRRRGPTAGVSPVAFYRRLLAILARRRRLRPRPSQTPREFAAEASRALAGAAAGLASLPVEVAELLYRVRYGGVALTEAEGRDVERRLGELDAALAGR
jgi:transglutaminase-like putative cysteine protease